jgi:putative oxidoreductase
MQHNHRHRLMHDAGLFLLRVGFAVLMMPHGLAKLDRYMSSLNSGEPVKFMNFLGLGSDISLLLTIFAELVAPFFLVIGFQSRWFAGIAAFCMAVAAFWAHRDDPLKEKEHALLYLISFLVLALTGPGRYSLDAFFHKHKD